MIVSQDDERPPPVAVVTGAGKGIGRAIAAALARAGLRVACVSREAPGEVDIPHCGIYYQADITDLDGHASLLARIAADLGEPTCLVNNAGITSAVRGDMLDLTIASFDATIGVNLRAGYFLSQAFSRRLVAAKREGCRSLIFLGSANAEILGENRADYCISKAGVAMMAKLFAARLAAHDIAVYEIRPGIIRTEMTAPATEKYDAFIAGGGVPMRRWGAPDEIGQCVAALATGAFPFTTGIHIDVGGGLHLHRV